MLSVNTYVDSDITTSLISYPNKDDYINLGPTNPLWKVL